ncbi:hypothetical protein AURDEDRAFT_109878 [Auricularia subglabra TFB-10046 SS5]|nr:hypothetical protein AURDEDRAFT_109878 [Auricularia subglabra TFB-10046 SS5]
MLAARWTPYAETFPGWLRTPGLRACRCGVYGGWQVIIGFSPAGERELNGPAGIPSPRCALV